MNAPPCVDGNLIEAARGGDAAALDRLLSASQPDLMRFARRTCSNAEDAQDAVQTGLWQLHRRIGTLRVIAAFASWLFRIVERECRRLLGLQHGNLPFEAVPETAFAIDPIPSGLRCDLVIGETALGNLNQRQVLLGDLANLPQAIVATSDEVLYFIDRNGLAGTGLGYVAAHLLASAQLMAGTVVLTRDKRLQGAALRLNLAP